MNKTEIGLKMLSHKWYASKNKKNHKLKEQHIRFYTFFKVEAELKQSIVLYIR